MPASALDLRPVSRKNAVDSRKWSLAERELDRAPRQFEAKAPCPCWPLWRVGELADWVAAAGACGLPRSRGPLPQATCIKPRAIELAHVFSERQWLVRNPVVWVTGAVAVVAVGLAGGATWALGSRNEFLAVLGLGVAIAFLMTSNLATRVEPRRLVLAYWPIWRRTLDLHRVRRAWSEPYDWWRYGGWGIRLAKGAIAYSVWGKTAVRLELEGWDLVVATPNPEALLAALEAEGVRVDRNVAKTD